ncbi:MAG: nuclear transport factor 2 family protein [Gammaproteobacteria bacterium]|nr:nuclear transport factor 2 family protein [Gammaproteobacteria bacterium]
MNRVAWMLSAVFGLCASAQAADTTMTLAESELIALDQAWIAAEVGHDRAALERILHEQFLNTFSSGKIVDRAAYIDWIMNTDIDPFEVVHEEIRVHGDTALVIDRTPSGTFQFSWVAVKRDGQWRVISESMSKVAPPAATGEQNIAEVWAREDEYWRYVKAGDVENYVSLWDENFIGWPCGQDHPMGKASIGDWVQKIRDEGISVDYELTHEGASDFGNTVVAHYRFTRVDTYPDGRVEGQGRKYKITHTWMKGGDTWQIIGGMCGDLSTPAQ